MVDRNMVLIISLGSTAGLRAADEELARSLHRAGANTQIVRTPPPRQQLRTLALIDLAWAWSARRATVAAIAQHQPQSIIYSTTTAALLWPRPGAIRFDAPAAGNRLGRHGIWQRSVEHKRLAQAPLLLPWSAGGLAEAPQPHAPAVVLPVPVEFPSPSKRKRDIAAITYGANPHKKGLDRVLNAWSQVRRAGETLVVAGTSEPIDAPGVESVGLLSSQDYRELLLRSRVFITAPRREDYGIAQLEALAHGCMLVTTPTPGPYAALPLARKLDARLVGHELSEALRAALDSPSPHYYERATELLQPYTQAHCDCIVGKDVSEALLASSRFEYSAEL